MNSENRRKNYLLLLFLIVTMATPLILSVPAGPITETPEEVVLHKAESSRYVVIPLSINVVEGTTVSKAWIEANIRRMNAIYNCEVVIFVWNGTIGTVPDPDGTPDGNISGVGSGGRGQIRGNSSSNAGGHGIGITIGGDLGPNTNGITAVGDAHGAIVRNNTDGDTWAHEVQHSLGQSHGPAQNATEDINGAAPGNGTGWDINGDGKINSEDMQYNLWGRHSDRTGSLINCSAILNASDDVPGAVVKQRPQNVASPPNNASKTGVLSDLWDDVMNWTSGLWTDLAKYVDILKGGVIKDYTTGLMKFWLEIGEMPIEFCAYSLAFDYDPTRGDSKSAETLGADLLVTFRDMFGAYEAYLETWDNVSGSWIPPPFGDFLGPFDVTEVDETVNYANDMGFESGYWIDSFFDVYLSIEIPQTHPLSPMLFGPLDGEFDMWVTGKWNDSVNDPFTDETARVKVSLEDLPLEQVKILSENVTAGKTMQVNGTNFAPDGNITIYYDGVIVGNLLADSFGSFSATITIPDSDVNRSNVILMVQDDQGSADAVYTNAYTIIAEVPGIPGFPILFIAIELLAIVLIFHRKKSHPI